MKNCSLCNRVFESISLTNSYCSTDCATIRTPLFEWGNKKSNTLRQKERYNSDPVYRQAILDKKKRYREKPQAKEKALITNKRWRDANPEKVKAFKMIPWQRAKRNLRKRISAIIKGKYSSSKSIGCNADQLKAHLQSTFKEGMHWNNYGAWHVDHIIPLASARTVEELVRLNHWTNLQALWAEDNMKKGSTIYHCGGVLGTSKLESLKAGTSARIL